MSEPVLALGTAAVCASGCVWYLPALTDARARADRPVSCRLASAACLTAWATIALLAPLALLGAPWQAVAAVVIAGSGAVLTLALQARRQGDREEREESRRWAALRYEPVETLPGTVPDPRHSQRAFPAWTMTGLALAFVVGVAVLAAGLPAPAGVTAVSVVVMFLTVAGARARVLRRRVP